MKVTVEGIDSIDKDFDAVMKEIDNAVNYGLDIVKEDMTNALQVHIIEDVYEKYEPRVYLRRFDYPEYGVSMSDSSNMDGWIENGRLHFFYTFSGWNTAFEDFPHYSQSDKIIKAIQDGGNYPWDVALEPRPFWDNFVADMIDKGMAEQYLVKAMNYYDDRLQVKGDGKVIKDGNDGGNLHW